MSETCKICSGAIPDGKQMGGHTALCAGVVSLRLGDALHALRELADASEEYASSDSEESERRFDAALDEARKFLGSPASFAPVLRGT